MARRASRPSPLGDPPPLVAGLVVAAAAVALITALIFALGQVSPPASSSVAYVPVVLLVSIVWGLRLGLLTSLASAAAFDYFHLQPTGRFTIADSGDWVAIGIFLLAAVTASAVASLARTRAIDAEQRRREAQLAAELAGTLLESASVRNALDDASERLAATLGLGSVAILLDAPPPTDASAAFDLCQGERRIGSLAIQDELTDAQRRQLAERIVPALETMLATALERDRLQSEVVETRALRRSDELKTALLRSVSHDLRTPLTAILTAGSALVEWETSRRDRQELGAAIVEEAERLTALVEKLLDLSRLEAGASQPRPEWCSVEELLREAAESLDPGGTRFSFAIASGLPLILADAAQLERAFSNLLDNAARYSGADRVSVRARVVAGRLMVRIVDRGPGIAHDELTRVFEAFYRGSGQQTGQSGSGLGLAIVKGFVEANGGRVWAESLPGQGTSFVVALPVEREAPAMSPADEVHLP
ncbi:MAG: ATP-binding protein [Solirubrobacteraceae bacterium]|nr:ATP-binding protein [Solirubrobacteraceae bacterium]